MKYSSLLDKCPSFLYIDYLCVCGVKKFKSQYFFLIPND